MKRTDYIHIQGWMVSDLKLKGNELLVFATIHGFSKDGVNKYRGSISYVSEFISISKRSVVTILSNLVEKGYVSKEENPTGNLFQSLFFGDEFEVVKKLHRGSEKVAQVSSEETSPLSSEKVAYNNNKHNNNNTYNNMEFEFFKNPLKDKKNKKEKPTKESFEAELWPSFDDWWELYDKKTGKPKCEAKFKKLPQATKEKIMQHTEAYIFSQQDKQFRKNPLTYLNNESWNDEIIKKSNNDGKQQALNQLGTFTFNYKRERDNAKNNNG